jgi:hypothetical protein
MPINQSQEWVEDEVCNLNLATIQLGHEIANLAWDRTRLEKIDEASRSI